MTPGTAVAVFRTAVLSRFQVVMRTLVGSGDSPSAKATTRDASKPKNEHLIAPRLYQFVIAVWRAKALQELRVDWSQATCIPEIEAFVERMLLYELTWGAE